MRQQKLNFKIMAFILILLFILLAAYGGYSILVYGNRWFAYSGNTRVRAEKQAVTKGTIFDKNGIVLAFDDATGNRSFQADLASRKAVVHILGDTYGYVSNGVESFQARYLYGFETSFAERLVEAIRNEERKGDNIYLTIDSKLSTAIAKAFGNHKGGAFVMNYETGEVLAMVSLPGFDPNNITQEVMDDPGKPFWNRVTQARYPPGSTFKIITMVCALQNMPDALTRTWECPEHLHILDQEIRDAGGATHGKLNLMEAFTVSCNKIFAQIAIELGDGNLRKTAESFNFNHNVMFRDLVVENSTYPNGTNGTNGASGSNGTTRNDVEIAWSGVGQSQIAATPLHMCLVAATIANNGIMMEPRLLQEVKTENNVLRLQYSSKVYSKVITEDIAKTMQSAMERVVYNNRGTGGRAAVQGLNIRGKTGSAESALDGQDVTHAWFVGYIENSDMPYAVSILVESGGSGGSVAAPIAQKIFEYIKNNR